MQYSSVLISSKLRAELATYVRQLCKISDRAHVQNLTRRELQDNDRKKKRGYTRVTGKEGLEGVRNRRETYSMRTLHAKASRFVSLSECRLASIHRSMEGKWSVSITQTISSLAPALLTTRDVWGLLKVSWGEQSRESDCCHKKARVSTTHRQIKNTQDTLLLNKAQPPFTISFPHANSNARLVHK